MADNFWIIENHEELPSTQDVLKERNNAQEGLVIHALKQSAGRGRYARKWESPRGNLSFSFLLKPKKSLQENVTLSLITGIVLTRIIKEFSDDVVLKWPNDVMLGGKKCAGILLESLGAGRLAIGVGVNIAHAPLEDTTCLRTYAPQITQEHVLERFLKVFEEAYTQWKSSGFVSFVSSFEDLTYKKETIIQVKLPDRVIKGSFKGIDAQGNLLILCTDTKKVQKITAGDVFLV